VRTTIRPVDRVAAIPSEPLTRAESLFGELDGCDIHSGTGYWVACVLGIHVEQNEAWIQLSLVGVPSCSLVVHLLPAATGRQTIGAIGLWLDRAPVDRPAILEVM
jgi:hypothetical protein